MRDAVLVRVRNLLLLEESANYMHTGITNYVVIETRAWIKKKDSNTLKTLTLLL